MNQNTVIAAFVAWVAVACTCFAAWLTHVIWIIHALASAAGATAGQIVLGVLGAFLPPIGVIHGLILWFA